MSGLNPHSEIYHSPYFPQQWIKAASRHINVDFLLQLKQDQNSSANPIPETLD